MSKILISVLRLHFHIYTFQVLQWSIHCNYSTYPVAFLSPIILLKNFILFHRDYDFFTLNNFLKFSFGSYRKWSLEWCLLWTFRMMFLVTFYSVRFSVSHILFCVISFPQLLYLEQGHFLNQYFLPGLVCHLSLAHSPFFWL